MQEIQKEFGSFDAYLWSFIDGKQIDNKWKTPEDVPTVSDLSERLSRDMKNVALDLSDPLLPTHSSKLLVLLMTISLIVIIDSIT